MKYLGPLVVLASAITATTTGLAQELGQVLSSQPVIQQVAVPRQVCSTQAVAVQQPNSGAGAVMGAIAGGAIGNQIGRGGGNAVATMLGVVGGAIAGDRIEGAGSTQVQNVQNCVTQNIMENRTVGYNVTYQYAGRQYTVQMPQDPGPTLALQVSPAASTTASAPVYQQAPVVYQQAPVVVQPASVVYQPYYAQPYYPPVSVNLGIGFWGGGYRHWH